MNASMYDVRYNRCFVIAASRLLDQTQNRQWWHRRQEDGDAAAARTWFRRAVFYTVRNIAAFRVAIRVAFLYCSIVTVSDRHWHVAQ